MATKHIVFKIEDRRGCFSCVFKHDTYTLYTKWYDRGWRITKIADFDTLKSVLFYLADLI